jgi:hypothetical protein
MSTPTRRTRPSCCALAANGGQPVIEHRAQHLDELSVCVGVWLQLGADLGQGGRQIPVLERSAVAQGAGLPHQHRQIMPGIVNDLVPPEVARVIVERTFQRQRPIMNRPAVFSLAYL